MSLVTLAVTFTRRSYGNMLDRKAEPTFSTIVLDERYQPALL